MVPSKPHLPSGNTTGKKKSNIEVCNKSSQWSSQYEINETNKNSKGLRCKIHLFKRDKKNKTEKQGMNKK